MRVEFYQGDERNLVRRLSSWVVDIAVALAFAWFCLNCFGTRVTVIGQSMQPLLNSDDVVLVNSLVYDFGKPDRMDVVVFEREDKKLYVKRVIGIPGDVVQIQDGTVYVNEQPIQEEGLGHVSLAGLAEKPVELGEGEYFLLGDNLRQQRRQPFCECRQCKRRADSGKSLAQTVSSDRYQPDSFAVESGDRKPADRLFSAVCL